MLTISWASGSIPVNYSAIAVPENGTALHCVTEDSSCQVAGLQCGQQYAVSVKPVSSMCEGHTSVPETVNSGMFVSSPIRADQRKENIEISFSFLLKQLLMPALFFF